MGQVAVAINGKTYRIACDDGQEQHLSALAGYVDQRVAELVAAVGQIGDTRLLVMTALLIADELSDLKAERDALRGQPGAGQDGGQAGGNGADQAQVAETVDRLAARLEALASRLEAP